MAIAVLWLARIPADSTPWKAAVENPASLIPPTSVLVDLLPFTIVFGIGISLVVAPLTSTLMGSVSGRYSGLASAINNSISRVGQPLIGALVFIVISATYYGSLGSRTGIDTADPTIRRAFQPLNPPGAAATPAQVAASNQASIEAFHLALIICAALLAMGAFISWYGLRDGTGAADRSAAGDARETPAGRAA
jgi:hypothetical protein